MLHGACTLLQVQRVSTVISREKCNGTKRLKIKKSDSSAGSGVGSDSKKKQRCELNGQTWSSGHCKHIETASKQ